jgi:protein-S-isoprenylcysteine O-methyltransferase Ste14
MLTGILVTWVLVGALLFIGAGRLNWGLGWFFWGLWGLLKLLFILLLRWHDPELLMERVTKHENAQPYERLILPLYFVMSFGTIVIAGLDGGRFGWSGEVPIVVIIIAYVIYLFGNGLASWAAAANPFFSSESRLQSDRGQVVTRMGPYQYIRHPAYSAAILIWPVTGLLLSSYWAIIPGFLAAGTMLIRTVCEDRMLLSDLPGYAEYANQVRYRLIPGIW